MTNQLTNPKLSAFLIYVDKKMQDAMNSAIEETPVNLESELDNWFIALPKEAKLEIYKEMLPTLECEELEQEL